MVKSLGAIAIQLRTSKRRLSSRPSRKRKRAVSGSESLRGPSYASCEVAKIAKIAKIAKSLRRPSSAE